VNAPQLPHGSGARIAREAREQFVARAEAALPPMVQAIRARLAELLGSSGSSRDMYGRRDAMVDFDRKGSDWARAVARAWRQAIVPPTATARVRLETAALELIGDEVVERKILSSRLALAIADKSTWELNDLRLRMQHLENSDELSSADVLRPEALCQLVVEQWGAAELTPETWALIQDVVQQHLVAHVPDAYRLVNEFLVAQGVMRDIDLSTRLRRGAGPAAGGRSPGRVADTSTGDALAGDDGLRAGGGSAPQRAGGGGSSAGGHGRGQEGHGTTGPGGTGGYAGGGVASGGGAYAGGAGTGYGQTGPGWGPVGGDQGSAGFAGPSGYGVPGADATRGGGTAHGFDTAGTAPGSGPGAGPATASAFKAAGERGGVADETRLMTSSPPLARARMRASGVLGQLRRLLAERVAGFDGHTREAPSPALAEALEQATLVQPTRAEGTGEWHEAVYDDAAVQEIATDLRRRTGELKKKAATSSEKATIEIVALMFQSILAEERIPPAIRVWFARLQMPVLRVAIAEPEFFGSLEHPARQLIDRMGSCVMGFDASSIGGSALEAEIKRVVQVIEQYPETGRRVFQLVHEEFQKFLGRFLTETAPTQRVVSVAQQVEQKETLAIQYTIELRSMLADMPVREEIREFLFKVWAEVLALAAVRNGPQHEETLALKTAAADLVWAASAKPNRKERARVIQDLPRLLQRLRKGMTLVGVEGKDQEVRIKAIGDTLADAFLSKTEAIPHARIDAMAKRLAHLEDFVADDPATDLPLDAESLELMLGLDASAIVVVADGGSRPSAAMLAWAGELQLGTWFSLDHNGVQAQVQYAWRSERKQLHLFVARAGRSYLIQARRLAAYLQAGLLLPAEEEALTVRATRDALAKLDANPERLLQ
jgi:hypothetical protein